MGDNNNQRIEVENAKTMAYFLKDRPEGIPMSTMSKQTLEATKHQTRSVTRARQSDKPSQQKSISRVIAPKLKIIDGQVVLDESQPTPEWEDLTKGMAVVHEEPNRHFTSATYSKRHAGANRWSLKETDLFFEALSMCGTDFSMISTLFPHRNRNQIKGKFKIEERNAPHRVSTALAEKKPLNVSEFAAKLVKIVKKQ